MSLEEHIERNPKNLNIRTVIDAEKAYSQTDLDYMGSLSAAVLQKSATSTKILLWTMSTVITLLITWMALAEVDEITRGEGKVIPSSELQKVQNLEGGIVSEILVSEGEIVEKGQVLLRIDDVSAKSSFQESQLKIAELQAKQARLEAEYKGTEYKTDPDFAKEYPQMVSNSKSLLIAHRHQLESQINTLKEQLMQRKNELSETQAEINKLSDTLKLIEKEVKITQPLVKRGIVSEVEFLKLQRQQSETSGDMKTKKLALPRIRSTIQEIQDKINETDLNFKNRAQKEYNEVSAELGRLRQTQGVLEDKVKRTAVRSPVKGKVNQLLINTIGGVVQPGRDLVEIVPLQDSLFIEAKIKPADIAFLHPGQKAVVKFTAYDFAIHGGLEGKVVNISADTVKDEVKKEDFYQVKISTEKGYLGAEEKPLEILVGMTAQVDILTGKKTILEYLMKPIFKAKDNALRER